MLLSPVPNGAQLSYLAPRLMRENNFFEAPIIFGKIYVLNNDSLGIALNVYHQIEYMNVVAYLMSLKMNFDTVILIFVKYIVVYLNI